ncbi:Beta-lactamase-related domain-containing protein [Sphingomonas antarctica]|uniref:serine hydrolase domain-containing protein n=1 Tax=Sphingomonas antarctica TaxID=2040274 RepID=UPI0039ED234F
MRFAALALLALIAVPAAAETVDQVAARYGLAGEILVGKGKAVVSDQAFGTVDPAGGKLHKAGARWRLASISKQITAALIVRNYFGELDKPMGIALPGFEKLTRRELLTHHSGLPNPDATPTGIGGVPSFYQKPMPDFAYCMSAPPKSDAPFSYNNCDYLTVQQSRGPILPKGITVARLGEVGVPGFVGGKPEPYFELGSWYTAGGFMGTARAVFDFDRSLMTGKLLPPAALAELWRPEGKGSYQALGQWVFPGTLKGCAKPKRIVQRDGEIYGVQARNFIFPDDDLVVIAFTNRSSDDFAFGEVWEGKGFTYDLLSAAACS